MEFSKMSPYITFGMGVAGGWGGAGKWCAAIPGSRVQSRGAAERIF